MIKYIIGGMGIAIVILTALLYMSHADTKIARRAAESAAHDLQTVTTDRDAQAKAVASLKQANLEMQSQMAEFVTQARNTQAVAEARLAEAQKQIDDSDAVISKLRKQASAAPQAAQPKALSTYAAAGRDWLQCKQQADRSGASPTTCADKVRLPNN